MSDKTVAVRIVDAVVARPGDTVVLSFKDGVTHELAARIKDEFARVIPDAQVIILSGGEVRVIRA